MSYTITAQVFQTNPNAFFRVVEKTAFTTVGTANEWGESNGTYVLKGASGTSGSLRFVSDTGERFIVLLGIHDSKRQAFAEYLIDCFGELILTCV
ncbi:hypothetical protein NLI96_g6753 [Meripilus lineatus]|uniref:Uncharacterized protein n=1 Tax=Meripilus lineatus TaxID=2056292 RepID=A0AAD5V0N9_9APHY|nr:hypothetical protein NLI96_g6753 [Physisporinus lineatus]